MERICIEPEYIITLANEEEPKKVEFKDLFHQKEFITSLTFIWDTNCYYVNVYKKFFIINGGKKVTLKEMEDLDNPRVLYARRNLTQKEVGGNDDNGEGKIFVTFLLGIEGEMNGERKEIFIHISPDGKVWTWKNKR